MPQPRSGASPWPPTTRPPTRYALHINDLRLGGRWDDKGVFLFYLELITDLFHMVVYLAFFLLICTYYGLPRTECRRPQPMAGHLAPWRPAPRSAPPRSTPLRPAPPRSACR